MLESFLIGLQLEDGRNRFLSLGRGQGEGQRWLINQGYPNANHSFPNSGVKHQGSTHLHKH